MDNIYRDFDNSGTIPEPKHSGLGIASFIVSILAGVGIFCTIVAAGVMQVTTPGGMDKKATILVGLAIIGLLALDLVALGLGIAALFQRERKKLFAILGTIFSGVMVALTLALVVYGNSAVAKKRQSQHVDWIDVGDPLDVVARFQAGGGLDDRPA